MPRVRVRVPVEIEVDREQLEALEALSDVAKRVRASGLLTALRTAVEKTGRAVTKRRR